MALNMDFVCPTEVENTILGELDNAYTKVSEMSFEERAFLNALILRNEPRKLLEIGVSSGGSSIVILNAIKSIPDAELYSIDLNDHWYKDNEKKTGYFVDNYQYLKSKWKLFTGALTLKFIEQIGSGIDFCLIDTAHVNPGEILDVLMVLPFLEDNAIIIFHDTALHTHYYLDKKIFLGERAITNNLLMSSVTGKKYLQGNYNITGKNFFPNIGGIKLSKNAKENVFEIFNLLMIKWTYLPTKEQEEDIITFLGGYYDKYYIEYLKKVFIYQRKIMAFNKRNKIKSFVKKALGEKNIMRIKKIMGKI